MTCDLVQEKLSEYLDGLLDLEVSGIIQNHLASCPRCQAELRAMAWAKRIVADLPVIDPPPGFTQRVMGRVREEPSRGSFWQRLFLPMRIKIPIHAFALVLIIGIAVYLYQALQPMGPVETESIPSAPGPTPRQEQTHPSAPQTGTKKSFAPAPTEQKPEGPSMERTGRAMAKAGKTEEAAGGIMALMAPFKAAADFKLSLTPREEYNDTETMNTKLEALAQEMRGEYIRPKGMAGPLERDIVPRTETVLIVIPADRYDRLKIKLAALGKIEEEIRIPPSSPESVAPPAPRPPAQTPSRLRIELTIRPADKP